MNRARKVLVALGIVLALVAIAALGFGRPEAREPAWSATRENTALYEALLAQGIPDALVDVTQERALVRYDVPEGMSRDEAMWRALGAAAATSASADDKSRGNAAATGVAPQIVLQVVDEGRAIEEIVVATEDVQALLRGELTREDFAARMERTPAA